MFGIGLPELLVVAVVALLVLGPARLPELARSLGKGLAEFRRASADLRSTIMDATQDAREPLEEMQRELRDATKVPPVTPAPSGPTGTTGPSGQSGPSAPKAMPAESPPDESAPAEAPPAPPEGTAPAGAATDEKPEGG